MLLKIATRKSELALWQANYVAKKLEALDRDVNVELVPMSTRGDDILDRSLQKIGGKGLFIKELEIAMQAGKADIAVHSMKDVPAEMPAGFCIASVLPRANAFDALITPHAGFRSLPEGACIGSSSLRRQAQILAIRPDLVIKPLRGNVNTRLSKLESGQFDAIILAAAGLERLGLDSNIREEFTPDVMLPAAAQGVIGVECLQQREDLLNLLSELDDIETQFTTTAERAVARRLEASCQSPMASYATLKDGRITLQALVAAADGGIIIRESQQADTADATALGEDVANRLLERGAAELLQS